ncbi:sulfotransferase family protein [Rubrivirga sp.]|uniref:sulfotransferase family protein n=1 Tax=Rubrivirga sp. TaxID=1885344 RepID=UPI003B516456
MNAILPAIRGRDLRQEGALPTFLIIGAMKCGTTSLHYYLSLHPEIGMSAEKELAFFVAKRNWHRGERWYRRQFDPAYGVRGEASPHYTCFSQFPDVPERMHALVPEARLIYLVRDPVDRLVSHYCHAVSMGREDRPLAEAVREPDSAYLARSQYHCQIARYLPYYGRDQILVVDQDDLLRRRRATLGEVFAFVGADPDVWDPRFEWERHRTDRKRVKTALGERVAASWPMRAIGRLPNRYRWPIEDAVYWPVSRPVERPVVSPGLRAEIARRLEADVARWRAFTGRPFSHWSL